MATALVTVAAMVAAFRPDGIALDRLCVLRATTIMLIRATADLSTERDMPIRAASLQCRAALSFRLRRAMHRPHNAEGHFPDLGESPVNGPPPRAVADNRATSRA
jgi:hypothetical protein